MTVRVVQVDIAAEAGDEQLDASLAGRLHTAAWGNSRPLVWARGDDAGAANRRVELYLRHGDFEAPTRRPLVDYARRPGAPLPDEASPEVRPRSLRALLCVCVCVCLCVLFLCGKCVCVCM